MWFRKRRSDEEAPATRGLEAASDRADRLLALEDLREMGYLSQRDYIDKTKLFVLRAIAGPETVP